MRKRGIAVLSLVWCVLIAGWSSAQANRPDPYKYPPAVDHSPSTKARTDLATARVDQKKAKDEFESISKTLRADLENSDEWKNAQAALKRAMADHDTARATVLAQLDTKPEYRAAKQRKAQAEVERDAVLTSDRSSVEKRADVAQAVLNAGKALTEMETTALNADAAATDAKQRLKQAADEVATLNKQFEATMKQSAKYKAAEKAVDDSNKKVATAEAALASATAKENKAEHDRQAKIDEIEKRKAADARRGIIR